jgi:hypothetical protein
LAKGAKMAGQTMSRHPQVRSEGNAEARREEFADGSALVTYLDGSVLILESALASAAVLREARSVNYNEPPPAGAGGTVES